jgi:hypothetical protein
MNDNESHQGKKALLEEPMLDLSIMTAYELEVLFSMYDRLSWSLAYDQTATEQQRTQAETRGDIVLQEMSKRQSKKTTTT